jgi:hypothetical protein
MRKMQTKGTENIFNEIIAETFLNIRRAVHLSIGMLLELQTHMN